MTSVVGDCLSQALDKLLDADDKPPSKAALDLKGVGVWCARRGTVRRAGELLGKLGWAHLARLSQAQLQVAFPANFETA